MNLKEIAEARIYFGGCGLCNLHNLMLSRLNKILKLHSTSRGSRGRGRPDWFFPFLFFFFFLFFCFLSFCFCAFSFNLEFCCVCAFKFSAIIYTWKEKRNWNHYSTWFLIFNPLHGKSTATFLNYFPLQKTKILEPGITTWF